VSEPSLQALVEALRRLPGVGVKSAQRMAFHLLQHDREGARQLALALQAAVANVRHCTRCHTFCEAPLCNICQDPARDARQLCVVETPADQAALERTEAGVELAFATILRATGRAVGSTRYLALRPEHRSLEIGWTWLAPSAWGTGANAEAKLLQLAHAFEGLGCRRVEFKTDALNERARTALAGLPAQFEGIHRKHMLVRGGVSRDSAWYSIVDDEWPAVRERLRERIRGDDELESSR